MAEQTNKKVLIIEDDKDFLLILKTKFASEGFNVATAEDGERGAATAGKENPDLILSDVLLPKMDGVEMVKKIKESDKNTPVIFLTNIKDPDYLKKIEELGGCDYLVKSDIRINDIVSRVKEKLGIGKTGGIEAPVVPIAPLPPKKNSPGGAS